MQRFLLIHAYEIAYSHAMCHLHYRAIAAGATGLRPARTSTRRLTRRLRLMPYHGRAYGIRHARACGMRRAAFGAAAGLGEVACGGGFDANSAARCAFAAPRAPPFGRRDRRTRACTQLMISGGGFVQPHLTPRESSCDLHRHIDAGRVVRCNRVHVAIGPDMINKLNRFPGSGA